MRPLALLVACALLSACETSTFDEDGNRQTTRFDSGAALDVVKAGLQTWETAERINHPQPQLQPVYYPQP